MSKDLNYLCSTMDAQVWTREWLKVIADKPEIPTDEGTMLAWFANAIMAGFDAGHEAARRECDRETAERLLALHPGND